MFYPVISREFRYIFRLIRPWRSLLAHEEVESLVKFGKEKFLANVDVQQFKPEDITIKVTDDNTITVEGKHEDKPDENGCISRHFVKRFVLPKGHDMKKVESKLSSDGILTISAPRIIEEKSEEARSIPITKTGKPFGDNKNEEK